MIQCHLTKFKPKPFRGLQYTVCGQNVLYMYIHIPLHVVSTTFGGPIPSYTATCRPQPFQQTGSWLFPYFHNRAAFDPKNSKMGFLKSRQSQIVSVCLYAFNCCLVCAVKTQAAACKASQHTIVLIRPARRRFASSSATAKFSFCGIVGKYQFDIWCVRRPKTTVKHRMCVFSQGRCVSATRMLFLRFWMLGFEADLRQ